ncbi:MAG: hypothetical protein IT548_15180 [Alphaproteobacteria bacterium]|nr:hypothetical protein [Alphaproteobacteria bacterium]
MTFAVPDYAVSDARRAHEPTVWAAAFALAAIVGCALVAAAPLAAYVWLIALFGIPHVLAELRYCDERFAGRAAPPALAVIGALLGGLVLTRLLGTYGLLSAYVSGPLELGFGAAMAFAAAVLMRRRRIVGFLAAAGVAAGALYAPFTAFLIWAWLHNVTPLGFVAEALEGRARTRALLALSVPFFLLPGFVALGGLQWLAQILFTYDAAYAPSAFGAGLKPLQSFLPPAARLDDVLPLFQAAVVSQVMHYVAVIVLLPRLLPATASRERLVPWPRWGVFYAALAVAGLASLSFYYVDFSQARAAYALAATLHSWIELPVFLLALGGGFTMPRSVQSPPAPTPH